jgi:hypothetical protein
MKLTYAESALIENLANRAINLGSNIKQVESQLHWLKKEHAQVKADAEAVHELLMKSQTEGE